MPGFNRTGPGGINPMSGGGRGLCGHPGGTGGPPAGGRAFFGRGSGRGWRNQYYATGLSRWQRGTFWNAPDTAEGEKHTLKNEADLLRARLQALEERLAAMQAENK
jgi:hypothetical protein